MLFVIDKPRLQRIIAIVRDDHRPEDWGPNGPYMRIEAGEGVLDVAGRKARAHIPATVYETGVLFLRVTLFRRLLRLIRNQKMLTIQVTGQELIFDDVSMPLEPNDMLLYVDPAKAPQRCPLEPDLALEQNPKQTQKPSLPLFDWAESNRDPNKKSSDKG